MTLLMMLALYDLLLFPKRDEKRDSEKLNGNFKQITND